MPNCPNRCQHIKVNGVQCGSPALHREKFCYFHQQWQEQRIQINANRARRARSVTLPVLEDANSIQVALMQVMRLIMSGSIDSKTAGLLLYALQTASTNLQHTDFEPYMHQIVLNPADAAHSPLGRHEAWTFADLQKAKPKSETVDIQACADERAAGVPTFRGFRKVGFHDSNGIFCELRSAVLHTPRLSPDYVSLKTAAIVEDTRMQMRIGVSHFMVGNNIETRPASNQQRTERQPKPAPQRCG